VNKVTKFIFRSFIALIVLFGLVEAVLWLAAPVEPDPGSKLIFNNQIAGMKERVIFEMGPDHLRRDGWSAGSKADGAVRIVCIGGSQTAAVLQNAEDAWWGQLRRQLEAAHPNKKFEFGALGVDSRGVLYGAKWARMYLAGWRPDLVIAQYGIEDVLLQPESYEYDDQKSSKIVIRRQRTGLKGFLVQWSQLCRRISLFRSQTKMKIRQKDYGKQNFYASILHNSRLVYRELDMAYTIPRPETADPIVEYKEGLSGIVSAARDAGAKVLFVGEPSLCSELSVQKERSLMMYAMRMKDPEKPLMRPRAGWVEGEIIRYYREGWRYAKEVRVPFINLHTQVPQDGDHFINEMILTDLGAKKVAELLQPEVEKILGE
jgi:hypothetical protein